MWFCNCNMLGKFRELIGLLAPTSTCVLIRSVLITWAVSHQTADWKLALVFSLNLHHVKSFLQLLRLKNKISREVKNYQKLSSQTDFYSSTIFFHLHLNYPLLGAESHDVFVSWLAG